jgi:heme A synthase
LQISRFALAAALLVIVSGAIVTSTGHGAAAHTALGVIFAGVLLAVAIRQRSRVAWTALALVALDAGIGFPGFALLHAVLAQLIFAVTVAGAHQNRSCPPEASSIRRFALAVPPLVLLQTGLGGAYRHKAIGVLPHMAGAMVVVLLTMLVCVVILQRFPLPGPLRSSAIALISVILIQISLGIAAFLMRLLDADQSPVFAWVAVAHVTTGALTLGASVILAMQFGRDTSRVGG